MATLQEARQHLTDHLMATYVSDNGHSGWGLSPGRAVSLTNTGEALRALRALGTLDNVIDGDRRERLSRSIHMALAHAQSNDRMRTRDLAYGALSLHWLQQEFDEERVFTALDTLHHKSGGWVSEAGDQNPSLIPTYHALLAQRLSGRRVNGDAIEWVRRLRRPDGQYAFIKNGPGSVAASCIALYVLAKSGTGGDSLAHLQERVVTGVNEAFDKMSAGDDGWPELDRATGFQTYYYGHALVGLNALHSPLVAVDIGRLLLGRDNQDVDAISAAFVVSSDTTTVPEILEFAIALDAIATNYDPYVYISTPLANSTEARHIEEERRRLTAFEDELNLRSTVVDALEKQLIQLRLELPSKTADELMRVTQNVAATACLALAALLLLVVGSAAPVSKLLDGTFKVDDASNWVWGVMSLVGVALAVWAWLRSRHSAR